MNNESVKNLKSAAKHVSHTDVLIVGAGISGLGAAYELKEQSPDQSFVILEGMDNFGGTWRCHKYPGLRSDSDLYTCLLYTSPSPRDLSTSRMPSSA